MLSLRRCKLLELDLFEVRIVGGPYVKNRELFGRVGSESLMISVDDDYKREAFPRFFNRPFWLSFLLVWLLIVTMVPCIYYFGYGADLWNRRSANRDACNNCPCFSPPDGGGCWDGRFKGSFPTNGYKSVWFNMDLGTAVIVGAIILYTALALEAVKAIIRAVPRMSWGAALCFAALIYSNYYGFWMIFNYVNDRNWRQLDNQLFFCLTEGTAAWLCIWLMDRERPVSGQQTAKGLVVGIAVTHIILAVLDQLRGGYFLVAPQSFQRLRDFFLLIPELVILALFARRPWLKVTGKCSLLLLPLSLLWFWILPLQYVLQLAVPINV